MMMTTLMLIRLLVTAVRSFKFVQPMDLRRGLVVVSEEQLLKLAQSNIPVEAGWQIQLMLFENLITVA